MSADDNAPEQAREVEVVARAMGRHAGWTDQELDEVVADTDDVGYAFTGLPRWHQDVPEAGAVLAALAPVRAAERQEAAREGAQAALTAALATMRQVEPAPQSSLTFEGGKRRTITAVRALLDDLRANGVTGRSGT